MCISVNFVVVAFLVALHQNKELFGKNGLLPAQRYLNGVKEQSGGITLAAWTSVPSIVWLFDYEEHLDKVLDYIAGAGLALSSFLIINGGANWFIMLTLWILYHSIVNIGQTWYSFGKEMLHDKGCYDFRHLKMVFSKYVNSVAPDQPVYLHSL